MLVRVCDHFKNNPKRIDKLIAIKGLPKDWIFRETPEGTELKKPWQPDVDKNIPLDIRHLCEPMYILTRYAALQAGAKEFLEKSQILGIRIDYNTEPGRQMWDDVERYIEETIPRNERIPVPVLCSRDERSAFETFEPRRNSRGSLELYPSPVPFIDLDKYVPVKMQEIPKAEEVIAKEAKKDPEPESKEFKCEHCAYTHESPRGVRMHTFKKHPAKEKVEA